MSSAIVRLGSVVAFAVTLYAATPRLLRALIRRRLSGYTREATIPRLDQPERLSEAKRVAVIGAGVAGLTAAVTLARRGFEVTIYEKSGHIGGKLGSWEVALGDGVRTWVSHGFHAFFPQYYNLNRFLDSLGLRKNFRRISDYVIMGRDGERVGFGALDRTPVFNLFALARAGVFKIRDALRAPGRDLYGIFLEYDENVTFDRYDHISFKAFIALAQVPPRLKLAFDTFARAFFANESVLSFAELIKSFHFYYLGHDRGLMYDYPVDDYERAILSPIRDELGRLDATLSVATPVGSLAREQSGFVIDGASFDKVILATDVVGAKSIVGSARGLPVGLVEQFRKLTPGQRYAVLRVWLDREIREDIPVFVVTERVEVLDALATYHRIEPECAAWAREHGGSVVEMHCYALPSQMQDGDVKAALLRDMARYFPELSDARASREVFNVYENFTAFHVGMFADRPGIDTGVPGFACAGDWVRLPFPAMLLEAACASGLCAANQLLREEGLREERVQSVPLRGLMAGIPESPARRRLMARV